MLLQPGTRLGPYAILGPIGSGGMGEVYRARDMRLGRDVAVKVLSGDAAGSAETREQLLREARTASALNHPNICTIFDVGEAEAGVFFAMELLEGIRLDNLAQPAGMPVEDVLEYGAQVAAALQHAHARGVIHCDLKPANIIVTPTGAKILDFGIATRAHALETEALTRSLAGGSTLSGTPAYMAPEQIRMQPPEPRTDIWSLGVVLYQAVSGGLPFSGETLHDVTSAILRDRPAPLPSHVPPGLRAIIERCLRKDASQRYQHAGEARAALETVAAAPAAEEESRAGDTPVESGEDATPTSRFAGRRLAWAALGIVLIAALGGSALLWKRRPATGSGALVTRTLAILPLRALNQQAADDFLGLGIADALITKASQLPGLTVRPISAVRAFAKGDVDAIEAAHRLQADVVLDGSVQHADQRVRVSLNLLDARNGASLWAESFDTAAADIFTVQDTIAREVATRLQVRLGPAEEAALAKRDTSNPEAYNYFNKAMYHLGNRGWDAPTRVESDTAIALFRRALAIDPSFTRARAQLAYTLAWTAIFIDDNPSLINEASRELAVAEREDPNLADVHVARSLIVWSHYGRWDTEAALREMRKAVQLNPSANNDELAALYLHCGLEDLAERHAQRGLALNPACETCKDGLYGSYLDTAQADRAIAARKEFWNLPPSAFCYLLKLMPAEAEPLVREQERKEPGSADTLVVRALLDAEQGRRAEAQAGARKILQTSPRNRAYHHATYAAATVFALTGDSREAVRLLEETRDHGFFSYPMLVRDRRLDSLRQDPDFAGLLAEAKTDWERLKAEFSEKP